jgi:hypothetical protein
MGDRDRRSRAVDRSDCQASAQMMLNGRIFGIALVLNFLWEMAQMFAYANMNAFSISSLLSCSGASVADAIYVTCVYWVGKAITHTPFWIFDIGVLSAVAVAVTGLFTGVILERIALLAGWWQYREAMPKLLFGVGLWPVLQLILLPFAVFWVIRYRRSTR